MPSASAHPTRLAVAAASSLLLIGGAAGCSTTQEKAEKHQAEAQRILSERATRQKQKKRADGPQTPLYEGKSAHRPEEGEK